MGTSVPKILVEEVALQAMRDDPNNMLDLTLRTYNRRQDDLLYLGRLHLGHIIRYDKIEPTKRRRKQAYNVKIEYYIRGVIPTIIIKAFDTYSMEKMQLITIKKKQIKQIIRICNQQSDQLVVNQLESLLSVVTSKLTSGRTLQLNLGSSLVEHKNLH